MRPDAQSRFELDRPLNLSLTLGPIGFGPWLRADPAEAWRAARTPLGPATIHLKHDGRAVAAEAWGQGAEWAVERAPLLCGQADDDSGFRPDHPLLRRLHRSHIGLRVLRTDRVFEAALPVILGQLVTTIEAHASYRGLVTALGEPAPGPMVMRLPPPPDVLASMPYWSYHRFGIERRRAQVIIRAARSVKRLEEIVGMNRAAAYWRMEAFPGIGPWTAAKVALVALGDADSVPVGDYHLPHAIGFALEGTPRSTDERMLELLDPYRGHRARVIRLITLAGIGAPRYGPHAPLRDIAHI
ncbi:MAG TPA: DNA-3-methyladenine glycosylase 2 family protein [Candidatus Dormibacteraeota bacterium]